jgi:hypothetical protein
MCGEQQPLSTMEGFPFSVLDFLIGRRRKDGTRRVGRRQRTRNNNVEMEHSPSLNYIEVVQNIITGTQYYKSMNRWDNKIIYLGFIMFVINRRKGVTIDEAARRKMCHHRWFDSAFDLISPGATHGHFY